MNSVASHIRLTSNEPQQKCIHCNTVPTDKFLTFDKTKYGQNTIVSQMKENDEQNIMCNKCHNAICREYLVSCLTCIKMMKKMCTLKFDMNKYSSRENNVQDMAKLQKTNSYICKSCHVQLQQKTTCVCCNRYIQKHVDKMYNKVEYDFTNFVVGQCLGHILNSAYEEQYICALCDKRLKETSNENPVLPYYAKYPKAVAGANFLKTLNQRPEYVCTCCHCILFYKTVQQFHMKDYDMSNETVKECLSHQYVMKLYRHTSHENDDMTTHKWPQFVPDGVEHDDIYVIHLYTLQKQLKTKKTKDAWPGMCKWSIVTWHTKGFTEHIAIGEKSDFSTNPIYNNTSHETISWPLQSKWSTCQCISKDTFIVHCDHNNRGGRVALIVNRNLNPKQIRMNTIFEIVVVEISQPIQMTVISVYRPPSTPIDVFMNLMLEIIAQFQHVSTCIVGDFNKDVSVTSNMHCCTMFRLQGFKQMVNKPTDDSRTIIDHVYMSQTLNTMQTDVTDCYYSDHDCILCLITM